MTARIKVFEHNVTLIRGQANLVLTLPDALALCDLLPPARAQIEAAQRALLTAREKHIEADLAAVRADLQALPEAKEPT